MLRGFDWCRDVDYGTLPQWLTFGLGVFVGIITVSGIITAWRSYAKSVSDSHIAQARLCYAVPQRRGVWMPNDHPRALEGVEWVDRTTRDQVEEVTYQDGSRSDVVVDTVEYVVIKVRNNSDEVISAALIELLDEDDRPTGAMTEFATIDPKREQQLALLVDHDGGADGQLDWSEVRVRLKFNDSVGVRWERVNARPPREIAPVRPGRLKRAWVAFWK